MDEEVDESDRNDALYLREREALQQHYQSSSDEMEAPLEPEAEPVGLNLEALARIEFSSWKPAGQDVGSSTANVRCLRVRVGETVTLIGQYDLWVKTGTVKLYGATLRGGPHSVHRIFAPATHALPQILGLAAESDLEIWQFGHSLRPLGRLSPLYRRLWNHNKESSEDRKGLASLNLRGVSLVCDYAVYTAADGAKIS